MVMRLSALWRDRHGASLTEGLIVFPLVFLVITSFIEGGLAVYQYNQVVKAVAVGARLAAVSDPVIAGVVNNRIAADPTTSGSVVLKPGDPYPINLPAVECGAGTTACDPTKLARLVAGSLNTGANACNAAAETGVMGMCDVAPRIRSANVRVSYLFTGLGYIGRPYNPVVTVKVEVRDVRFQFFLLGAIISAVTDSVGVRALTIPPQSVTITSEDLSTTPLGVTSG